MIEPWAVAGFSDGEAAAGSTAPTIGQGCEVR